MNNNKIEIDDEIEAMNESDNEETVKNRRNSIQFTTRYNPSAFGSYQNQIPDIWQEVNNTNPH